MIYTTTLLSLVVGSPQEIPIDYLAMELEQNQQEYSKTLLENEIGGIKVDHISLAGRAVRKEKMEEGYRFIYIFIKGHGNVIANNNHYDIVPETLFLPTSVKSISITPTNNDTLHFIRISSKLTEQDIEDLKEFPKENTQKIYYAKFADCEAYSEDIKSAKTISRTVLPNKYIPRIAMGTVEATGPDKVAPHDHAMLEQLFLGLKDNNVVVYADDANIDFPAYSLIHIPLGSSHSVEVKKGNKMYYMWMDFFLDKKGEDYLKNHKTI